MIRSSFQFIQGIGAKTERNLWAAGIYTWDDLKTKIGRSSLGKRGREAAISHLSQAEKALNEQDATFFTAHLPKSEHWRLYSGFQHGILFLDIETTGLSLYYDDITLIGTFDGVNYRHFLVNHNMDEFPSYVSNYKILVTFNGTLFDLPFLRKQFPGIDLPPIHIDLRYLLRSVGISGPLKKVETRLGIQRAESIQGLNGRTAVVLWNRFLEGDEMALQELLLYNSYDTANLQILLRYCYYQKLNEIKGEMNSANYQMELGESASYGGVDYEAVFPVSRIPAIAVRRDSRGSAQVFHDGKPSITIDRDKLQRNEVRVESLLQKLSAQGDRPVVVGIDLTGSEGKASGVCVLEGRKAHLDLLKTDDELVGRVEEARPSIVSIDSPLSLPIGRCCTSKTCHCAEYGITRECERILWGRGVRVYPCLIDSMCALTARGMRLTKRLVTQGYTVIESFPGAAQDVLGFPRKRIDLEGLKFGLRSMGIEPLTPRQTTTHDEIDALTSALVGYFFLAGEYEALGNEEEGYLIIPAIRKGISTNLQVNIPAVRDMVSAGSR